MFKEVKKKHLIKITYKSGYIHEFWVYSFRVKLDKSMEYEWVDDNNRPLHIGVEDIESIWKIGED